MARPTRPKGKTGYRVTFELAPSEAVPVVYGAMANWEHLKGLAGEPEDAQFRNALNQAHQDALPIRASEKAAQTKAETDHQAAEEAAAQKKAERTAAKVGAQQVKAQKAAEKQAAREAAKLLRAQKAKAGEEALSGTGVASSSTSAYSAAIPRNDSKKSSDGILSQVTQAVKENLNNAPVQLTGDLMRDGKSALNSVIRQGMKSVLKNLLSK